MPDFQAHPGYYFVAATLLPLASFVLILLGCGAWCLFRTYRETALGGPLYKLFGGDARGRGASYVAIAAIGGSFLLSLTGFILYNKEQGAFRLAMEKAEHDIQHLKGEQKTAGKAEQEELGKQLEAEEKHRDDLEKRWEARRAAAWTGRWEWLRIRPLGVSDPDRGTVLQVGFAIDSLAALMFVMVSLVATLIHLFSIGYMSEEVAPMVEDHQVDVAGHWEHHGEALPGHEGHGHLHRRGRFGRFFLYMSLFCFSMLNLVLADNLFQVFVSWELVGICSYLLIGFYFERQSASDAANKAFITNRIGDAGFIVGLLILWTYVGTFNFEDIFKRIRSPLADSHGTLSLAGRIVRANPDPEVEVQGGQGLRLDREGSQVVLFPRVEPDPFDGLGPDRDREVEARANPGPKEFGFMPYWLLVAAGLGIFLGCVGKSAQFPLQVWLPDAMEGPTPVSALIHAATMVAAGVYLVGRCYPLFTPEALLVIAYTGGVTLFVAATVAIVMTDIKKVLAYSTVSQLGYMMLALGIGGWVAGLFHLFTHAFFKALLFLGSGSVIYGCHHEQEMTKMGGLFPKMKVTALTMLAGVLAIAGIPLFSGWYSKDSILAQGFGYVAVHPQHSLLLILPLVTAGITAFYMARMWLMTFTGPPRDEHVYEHAHESPWTMTVPLIVLAVCSVAIAWGWPLWDAKASQLEHNLHYAQPNAVLADFGHVLDEHEVWPEAAAKPEKESERFFAYHYHDLAGGLALGLVAIGVMFASLLYFYRVLDPAEAAEQFPGVYAFLRNKWYFDELYSGILVRPALVVARWCRSFDLGVIDGVLHAVTRATVRVSRWDGRFDNGFVDYLVNLVGNVTYAIGARLRNVQTGSLRSYVLFLVLAAVAIFVALSYFVGLAPAR